MLEKLCLRGRPMVPKGSPLVSVDNPESGRHKVEVRSVRCVFGE